MINEGIIPHNFNWRAGIGKDVSPSIGISYQQNPSVTSIYNQCNSIYKNLLSEIDDAATSFCINNDNEKDIKKLIISKYVKLHSIYDSKIDDSFNNYLYYICFIQYVNTWANECFQLGINKFKSTEFICINNERHINPMLVYLMFTKLDININNVKIINEHNLMLSYNNSDSKKSITGFIEQIDMIYNDTMCQDKSYDILKTELIGKLQYYKSKYSTYLKELHIDIINYCNSKPKHIGNLIYNIFYA